MNAADLMTREIVAISPKAPLTEAIRRMLEHRVSGLPVVDELGQLIGLVTEGDLLHRVETGTDTVRLGWLQALVAPGRMAEQYMHTHGRLVQDVMTRKVLTVNEATSLEEIVRLMESRHVRRVPVVEGGRLRGIVSRSDLVRALGAALEQATGSDKDDAEIRNCIRAEMAQQRWTTWENIDVVVRDGVVELRGMIFDERMRGAMRVVAQRIPGVKAVRDHLELVEHDVGSIYGI